MAIDGTERRRQRPTEAAQQKELCSGNKKAHTDKNILLVNETTAKVVLPSARPWLAKRTTRKRRMKLSWTIRPTLCLTKTVEATHLPQSARQTLDNEASVYKD
ncbi:MAG TPA: hypothetical protein VHH94_01410 [Gammaproteobacteria bacterium]|nr:hypothetical protein [Gammaproteobacteria bacterium]